MDELKDIAPHAGIHRTTLTLFIGTMGACHKALSDTQGRKLLFAAVFSFVFMLAEFIGGYISNSLAIQSDALHLLTDIFTLLLNFGALTLASREATESMPFGYHRLEVLVALISMLLIWGLTIGLLYEAFTRIILQDHQIDAKIMLITSVLGIVVNVGNIMILGHHGHSHGLHALFP